MAVSAGTACRKTMLTVRPPSINSTTGDIIRIHATNGLGVDRLGTAIHAHGMMFNNTNWYDGAVGVTQCPIPPGETLTYDIDTSIQVRDFCSLRRFGLTPVRHILDSRPSLWSIRRRFANA